MDPDVTVLAAKKRVTKLPAKPRQVWTQPEIDWIIEWISARGTECRLLDQPSDIKGQAEKNKRNVELASLVDDFAIAAITTNTWPPESFNSLMKKLRKDGRDLRAALNKSRTATGGGPMRTFSAAEQ